MFGIPLSKLTLIPLEFAYMEIYAKCSVSLQKKMDA